MDQTVEEFFHDFRQEMLADAEANSTYQLEAFMETVSDELIETGFVEGFEHCHYRAPRGMRVDGYWFNDEGALDIFVADFDCRRELETLTRTEVDATFKRVVNFFEASLQGTLEPDVTTPEYGLARQIADRRKMLRQINFYLASERVLSDRFQTFPDGEVGGIRATYHIWDVARFQRQRSSRGHKEPLNIDFVELFGNGINCLPADLGSESYQSYLIVMPAPVLAALYDRYSARLLEQNVRTFLQVGEITKRRKVTVDYQRIWAAQTIDDVLLEALVLIATGVNEDIVQPPQGISNISEWCKREGCWTRLLDQADRIAQLLPEEFWAATASSDDNHHEVRTARQTQKIDDGIEIQRQVFEVPPARWSTILQEGSRRHLFTEKEVGVLRIAEQMPSKIPTERQSMLLVQILEKARQEGLL